MTAARPRRIVDAHVHLWDPARADWYPYLSGRTELGMGDVTGMSRRFTAEQYEAEAPGWNVEKLINVAAATGLHSIDETLEIDRQGDEVGQPVAIVGGIPPRDTVAEAVELLDRQLVAPRLRGVRPMGAMVGPLPPVEVLQAIQERGLVFDLMAHAHQLHDAAVGLAAVDGLSVVVEHVGWPRNGSDEEFALWQQGLRELAELGDHVTCKLSGLAMPLGRMEPAAFRPWLEHAIEVFGVDRCFFASNFPVDGNHGTLDQLWSSYAEVVSGLDAAALDQLFALNAERVYRC